MNFDNISHLWATVIIDQCVKNQVRHFYCCPGMRNAPLLRAINEHPTAQAYLGHDERSQSYRALGFLKTSGGACALVCTSGTAVANFLPAIIEAQKTQLPLLVLSADRPGELNAVDANQTINQIEVLRDYTKAFAHLSEPQESYPLPVLAGQLSHLLHQSHSCPAGPVHLNIPLREPLDQTPKPIDEGMVAMARQLYQKATAHLEIAQAPSTLSHEQSKSIIDQLASARKPLIVFGPLSRRRQEQQHSVQLIASFLDHYRGLFYCDVETGGKFHFGSNRGLIPTFDHPEVLEQLGHEAPDLILHIGHRLTSKHYYKYLSQCEASTQVVQILASAHHQDQGFRVNQRYHCHPIQALQTLYSHLGTRSLPTFPTIDWQGLIHKKEQVIDQGPLSYAYLSKKAIETCTNAQQFFIGNSTFIRSFDSYAAVEDPGLTVSVYANRGASGIEGHVATTLGMLEGHRVPTVLFLGDVSLIHDASSLFQLAHTATTKELPLLIVTANNFGGGIFKLLPIRDDRETLPMVTTPHPHRFAPLLESLAIPAHQVSKQEDYHRALTQWNDKPSLTFLEVLIDDDDNFSVYQQLKTVKL